MSRNDKDNLITEDDTQGFIDQGGQTSNKAGVRSTSVKPSNSGPDDHQRHKAPVPGATGNPENREYDQRDTYLGDQAPADKARK